MQNTFKAAIVARLVWKWDCGLVVDAQQLKYIQQFADGYAADQAEAVWYDDQAALLRGATRTLNLAALTRSLYDDVLTTVLASVRAILVINQGSGGRLVLGAADVRPWLGPLGVSGGSLEVPPGGLALLSHPQDGWSVDEAQCQLKLAAQDGDVTYSIALLGTLTAGSNSSSSSAG